MAELSKKQKLAISQMNRALTSLRKAGIRIAGYDYDLLYATNEAIAENTIDHGYCDVANACQFGNIGGTGSFNASKDLLLPTGGLCRRLLNELN